MSNPTGSEARPPERPTPVLTDAQRDGLACIRCHADFSAAPIPAVPAGLWNGVQVFRCAADCKGVTEADTPEPVTAGHLEAPADQAAEIDELIERTAEAAGKVFALRFDDPAGAMARRLMRDTLCRLVSGVEVDLVLLREAFMALRRGDLQTAERVWAVGR